MRYEVLHQSRATVGEGPLWDPKAQVLRWVDTPSGTLHVFDPSDGSDRAVELGTDLGSIALHADGGLALALRGEVAHFDPVTGSVTTIAEIEAAKPTRLLNDSGVDPAGRLWVGCVDDHEIPGSSSVYCVSGGSATQVLTGLTLANGIAWSPDGTTMYCVDSYTYTVFAYDYDPVTADVRPHGTLWSGTEGDGFPDGIAVDVAGDVWVAFWGGGCLRRIRPDGAVQETITLPVSQVSSCAFGGPGRTDLYITSATYGMDVDARADEPLAGALFRVSVGTPGVRIPSFSG
jgi:sugar lactone lactonase YvrE